MWIKLYGGQLKPNIKYSVIPQEEYAALKASHDKLVEILPRIQQFMEWGEKGFHINCSDGYVPMMPHGDPEPCDWCILKGQIEQALAEAEKII